MICGSSGTSATRVKCYRCIVFRSDVLFIYAFIVVNVVRLIGHQMDKSDSNQVREFREQFGITQAALGAIFGADPACRTASLFSILGMKAPVEDIDAN